MRPFMESSRTPQDETPYERGETDVPDYAPGRWWWDPPWKLYQWPPSWPIYLGGDEFLRRTLVVHFPLLGRLVIAISKPETLGRYHGGNVNDFDPHRPIPGTTARMTPEQEQAWANDLAEQIANARPIDPRRRLLMPDGRFVWITREQRDMFEYVADVLKTSWAVPVYQAVAAWDAARADPVAHVANKLRDELGLDDDDAWISSGMVCDALGLPSSDETTG